MDVIYDKSTYLGTMATVFQAEIFAIGQAAHHIITNPNILNNADSVDIITDSKSALQALDNICTSSKLIMDCKKTLDKLHEKAKVTIHWTKAHVGHEGNEKADTLAKEGTTKVSYQVEPIIPVPKSWIKTKIKQYLYKEWTNRWNSITEARQTKIFFPKPDYKKSQKLLCYDRQTCAKLFRWISGHSFHRYHNHLTNPTIFDNPRCRNCDNEKEEPSHLFAHCTGLMQIRMNTLGKHTLEDRFEWTPYQLLTMINKIDKICPEEGLQTNTGNQTHNNGLTPNTNPNNVE
jgi:ribonuclease HI